MSFKDLFALGVAIAATACSSEARDPDEGKSDGPREIACPAGELTHYSFAAPDVTEEEVRSVVRVDGAQELFFSPPDDLTRVRLDVCAHQGVHTLEQIAFMNQGGAIRYQRTQAVAWQVEGLTEALAGSPESLTIVIKPFAFFRVEIKGWTVGNSAEARSFVSAWVIAEIGSVATPAEVVYGDLEEADSFADMPCDWGEQFSKHEFKFETVTMGAGLCTFFGGGNTTGFEVVDMTMQDASENLPLPVRNRKIRIKAKEHEAAGLLAYEFIHHNEGDWIEITVPEYNAKYRLEVHWRMTGVDTDYKIDYASATVNGTAEGHFFLHHFARPVGEGDVAFLETLADRTDYDGLKRVDNNVSLVKYTYAYLGYDDELWFQNASMYPFHHTFLVSEIERFFDLAISEYSRQIFTSQPPSLAAGAVYWGPNLTNPAFPEPGLLGFEVYMSGGFDVAKVVATHARLKAAVRFANEQLIFTFPNQSDFFQFRGLLEAEGIPSTIVAQFVGADP